MFDKLSERAGRALYLSAGMYIDSNRELMIENCRRIEEYNDVFMRLISGRLCIQIWGSGLRAFDFRTKGLLIRGRIERIEFIERGGRRSERPAEGLR